MNTEYIIHKRTYSRCNECNMLQISIQNLPDIKSESQRYVKHNNDNEDYSHYISGVFNSINQLFSIEENGKTHLDYGCGQNPALSNKFSNEGFDSKFYDPIFHDNKNLLSNGSKYDIITAVEAAEHFHNPLDEFIKLNKLLNKGGLIIVLTQIVSYPLDEKWWYLRDNTHVCFYSSETIFALKKLLNRDVQQIDMKGFVIYG